MQKIPLIMAARRSGDAEIVYASTKKAERELNWRCANEHIVSSELNSSIKLCGFLSRRAKYGIDEMCRDQWNWARKNPWGYGSPESES